MNLLKTLLRRAWLALGFVFFAPWLLRRLAKLMLHEHLDCSLRPRTMLELMQENGYPSDFPDEIKQLIASGQWDKASREYQLYLAEFAAQSLANYVHCVWNHVIPLMQTKSALYRTTKERIEDAVADGIIGFELRFAPQLHTMKGLTLDEVMESVIRAVKQSPIPVKLVICSLRHEDRAKAKELVDLALKYKKYVGVFDLAADEHANSGVLGWWAEETERVRAAGILLTVHLWETEDPTDEDIEMLDRYDIFRLGHGVRGHRQGLRLLEVCPTSNVVTGQYKSLAEHPIDALLREGRVVTLNTDGTLLTKVQLSDEYINMWRVFGWKRRQFHTVNINALEGSSFSPEQKTQLRAAIDASYGFRG